MAIAGSLTNAFKAMLLIHARGRLKSEELAKELNVSKKQVQRYIKAMRLAGINVKTKSGPDGGHYLEDCPFCKKIIKINDEK